MARRHCGARRLAAASIVLVVACWGIFDGVAASAAGVWPVSQARTVEAPGDADSVIGDGGSPPPTRGSSIDTGAGQSRDVIGRSAGWPVLVAVLGLMAVVSLLALQPWRRRRR